MSLVLVTASSQYAALTPGFTPVSPYVVAMGCMFKTAAAATAGLVSQGKQNAINANQRIRTNLSQGCNVTEVSTASGDQASSNTYALNTWTWANAAFQSTTARLLFLAGTKTTNATSTTAFPALMDSVVIGAYDNGGIGAFFGGKLAHVWMANAWNDAWDASLRAGSDPRTVMGVNCVHYWPLNNSYADLVGGVTLVGVGSPTFDTTDQPVLSSGVNPMAPGRSLGRPAGQPPYNMSQMARRRIR